MTVVLPPSVPVDGMLRVSWVPTLADPLVPKLTEAGTAVVTAIDITCYLTKEGGFKSKFDQKTFVDSRVCTPDEWETLGAVSRSLEDLEYVYSPQAAAAAPTNAAYEKLVPGTRGYFVVREGIAYEAAMAIGQFVSVWGATLGARSPVSDTSNSVFKMGQKLSPYFFAEKVALVA